MRASGRVTVCIMYPRYCFRLRLLSAQLSGGLVTLKSPALSSSAVIETAVSSLSASFPPQAESYFNV